MGAEKRHVALEDETALHGIAAAGRLHIQDAAQRAHIVDGLLEVLTVLPRRIVGQYAYTLHRDPPLCLHFLKPCYGKEGK